MSRQYKFHNPSGVYFVSFATVYWIDIFTRQHYLSCFINSIDFCRANKGMRLYAYCLMPNHIHFVFRSDNDDPSGLPRDFKSFTSKKIVVEILNNPQESRKEWLLELLEKAGKTKNNVSKYQL